MSSRRLPHVPLPPASARADARIVALSPADLLGDLEGAARALPDPAELPAGTLVMVEARVREARSLGRAVLAALGRIRNASRCIRCSALVARGYVRVGASSDPDTRADWAWGYAPAADVTEPC